MKLIKGICPEIHKPELRIAANAYPIPNDAVDSLLELHCDFNDSINELEDAIEDCTD